MARIAWVHDGPFGDTFVTEPNRPGQFRWIDGDGYAHKRARPRAALYERFGGSWRYAGDGSFKCTSCGVYVMADVPQCRLCGAVRA